MLTALAWTAIGLVFALPGLSAGRGWRQPLLMSLAQWWSWGLVAPLIVTADRRLPFSDKQLPRRLTAHLLLSLPVTAGYIYVFASVLALMGLEAWSHRSAVVNIESVLQLEAISHGEFDVVLKNGSRSRISRTYRAQLERRLGQSL